MLFRSLPTLLSYVGLEKPAKLPGRDYAAALRGEKAEWDDTVYYEFDNTRAIRTREWKLVRRHPEGPDELYDLAKDPDERVNLARDGSSAERREGLNQRLQDFFARHADPKYDLWKGGVSKVRRPLAGP